jgi:hypothetical protein
MYGLLSQTICPHLVRSHEYGEMDGCGRDAQFERCRRHVPAVPVAFLHFRAAIVIVDII